MIQWNFITQEVGPNSISELKVDASFRKITKNAIAFHIWKIEEDRLEAVAKGQFGTFYDDCAYIVYASCAAGTYINQDTITRETKTTIGLERFIHFWLGERVSQQKKANVSHKVMELDTYFGNVTTEYRESQDNESARFLSYFRKGLTIMSGALTASSDPCRLYQLRGRKWLRCIEMENISWDNFSSDYIMILQTETHLFLWIGRSSSLAERRESLEVAHKLQGNRELIFVDDGYEQSMPDTRKAIWNMHLPLQQRIVNQLPRPNEKPQSSTFRLYSCGFKGTRYWFEQCKSMPPSQEDLKDSTSVYMLDGFSLGVWLWVGSQASKIENVEAMRNGRGFVKKKKYPGSTSLVRVVEGHEPIEFTRFFPTWQDRTESNGANKTPNILGKFDSLTLSERPKMAAQSQLIDDGTGERFIYRITDDQLIEIPTAKSVMFLSNSCCVVEYTVAITSNDSQAAVGIKNVIYQWHGSQASRSALAKCERFAKDRFGKLGDKSMMVQIIQGDETPHFLQIFGGKLIILLNDKSGNINNNNGSPSEKAHAPAEHFVLKVYGDSSYNSKAVQMVSLSSMTSKECYVIKANTVWIWCGQSSTGDAREITKNIASLLGECSLVMEGKEPKEFWQSISKFITQQPIINGNGSPHNGTSSAAAAAADYPTGSIEKSRVQLHLIYTNRGNFITQEILGFEQSDLSPENIYILDAGTITFIWLGARSPTNEQESYSKMVSHFLENSPTPRRTTTAVAVVRQRQEPNVFKGFFDNWNHFYWDNYLTYENKRQSLASSSQDCLNGNGIGQSNGIIGGAKPSIPSLFNHDSDFDQHQKYPVSLLQQEANLLPPEVNPLKREIHLTHDDFVALFNITFWEFDVLPAWKKQELKKKFKLF